MECPSQDYISTGGKEFFGIEMRRANIFTQKKYPVENQNAKINQKNQPKKEGQRVFFRGKKGGQGEFLGGE